MIYTESEWLGLIARLTQRVEALEAEILTLKKKHPKGGYLVREAAQLCGYKSSEGFLNRLRALEMEPMSCGGWLRVTHEQLEAVQRGQRREKVR